MDPNKADELYKKALKNISDRSLMIAMNDIYKLLNGSGGFDTRESFSDAEKTYRFLLKYLLEGKPDTKREKLFKELQFNIAEIATNAYEEASMSSSYKLYFEKKRSKKSLKFESIHSLQEQYRALQQKYKLMKQEAPVDLQLVTKQSMEETVSKLFYKIWLFGTNKEQIDFDISPSLVTALTFRLLVHFQEAEMMALIDACEFGKQEVHWRALCGIIILLQQREELIGYNPVLSSRISLLKDIPGFQQEFYSVLIMMIRTFEAESIAKKLEENIFCDLENLRDKITSKVPLKDFLSDPEALEKNPEWKELINPSDLEKKMHEINDLQQEGADVMLSSFAMLKDLPFFHEVANWFLPFDPEYSALRTLLANDPAESLYFLNSLTQTPYICSSDKYSFCFNIKSMPQEMAKGITRKYRTDTDELNKIEEEDRKVNDDGKGDSYAREYIQDLFRFFKFHPRRADFTDIFEDVLGLYDSPYIQELLSGTESLRKIAAFYFDKGIYEEAAILFDLLIESGDEDARILQQQAYCYQELGEKEIALSIYKQALALNPKDYWTLRKVAGCYRQLKEYDKAIEYAEKAGALKPDNLSIESFKAYCYLEQKNYEEALRCFHKINYLDSTNNKTLRPIAWCYFLSDKQAESLKYYDKILSNQPETTDYLNAGHAYWVAGDQKQAIELYATGAKLTKIREDFINQFKEDESILSDKGIPSEILSYMPDIIFFESSPLRL